MKMLRLGLISRIALLVICVEVVAFSALGWFYIDRFSSIIEQRTYSRLHLVGQMIANDELAISSISRQSIMSDLVGAPYLDGLVIGGNGRVIVSTNATYLGRLASSIPGFDAQWIADSAPNELFIPGNDTLTAIMHTRDDIGDSPMYHAVITISTAKLNALKRSITLWGQLGSLLFILLSSAGIVLIAQRLITRRVDITLKFLKEVEDGAMDVRIPVSSDDELGQLQRGINSMTAKVGALLNQHRRNEEEIRASSRLLDSIIENIPNMIFLKRASDLRFVLFNKAGEQLLGFDRQDMLGKNDHDLFPKEQADYFTSNDRKVLQSSKVLDIPEEAISTRDGVQHILHTHKLALHNSQGEVEFLLGISEDITRRKQDEEALRQLNDHLELRVVQRTAQLEEANKELEDFSYSMSHNMRSPLLALDGFTKILLEEHGPDLNDEGKRLLKVLRDNAQRMGRLIDDILHFLSIGRQRLEISSIDITKLASETLGELQTDAPERRLKLIIGGLPPALGDRGMIREALRNLLSNAIKFSSADAEVVIEIGGVVEKDENVYSVTDHGVGFDMRYADKLFKMFERVHPTGQYEGSGIGLALVKRIAIRHGGRVWAEGKVGGGATIHFALPNRMA